jgi:hypothetical protein
MNRGEIRDEIRRLVRDTDSTNPRWSDTVLNARIDISHEKISCLTKCIISRITDNLVSGSAEYPLPDVFLEEFNVTWLDSDGLWKVLSKKSERELDLEVANWRSLTCSTPVNYYIRRNKIGIVPYPDFSRSSSLRLDIARRPDTFTLDADIPFQGRTDLYPFHNTISYDVAIQCKIDDGTYQDASGLKALFDEGVRMIKYQNLEDSSDTRIKSVYEIGREQPRRTR